GQGPGRGRRTVRPTPAAPAETGEGTGWLAGSCPFAVLPRPQMGSGQVRAVELRAGLPRGGSGAHQPALVSGGRVHPVCRGVCLPLSWGCGSGGDGAVTVIARS